jgi:hypothetical protein
MPTSNPQHHSTVQTNPNAKTSLVSTFIVATNLVIDDTSWNDDLLKKYFQMSLTIFSLFCSDQEKEGGWRGGGGCQLQKYADVYICSDTEITTL